MKQSNDHRIYQPLFRVWSKNRKRYLTTFEIQHYIRRDTVAFVSIIRSDRITVERFSGHYDSTGERPLFVGDIVQTPAGRRFQIVNATRGPNIRIKALDTGAMIDNSFIPILDANIFIKTVHGKDMIGDMIEREDVE